MDFLQNFRQLYCCCGCSLKIGSILIAALETCYPILLTCSPANEPKAVIALAWVLYISASIILLYGSIKESPTVLFGWIIYRTAVIILNLAGFIYKIVEVYDKYLEKTKLIFFFLISMILYLVLNGYFWTIVYSYYRELKEKEKRKQKIPPQVHV